MEIEEISTFGHMNYLWMVLGFAVLDLSVKNNDLFVELSLSCNVPVAFYFSVIYF